METKYLKEAAKLMIIQKDKSSIEQFITVQGTGKCLRRQHARSCNPNLMLSMCSLHSAHRINTHKVVLCLSVCPFKLENGHMDCDQS